MGPILSIDREEDKMIYLLTLLLSVSAFAEKNINIELNRPDKTKILARLSIPNDKIPFPLILYLQGSSCVSVRDYKYELSPALRKKNYALLTIEKPGISRDLNPEDCFKDSYLLKNDVFTRADDALHVLNFIDKSTKWSGDYFLIGGSEGTVVATLLAKKKYPRALALLAGANGMTMEDEFYVLIDKKKRPCGFTSKKDLKQKIESIYLRPDSKETWCSSSSSPNSYYWWSRILRLSLLDDLKSFDFPIWAAHGTEDESVPIESSIEVEKAFLKNEKKNFILRRYPGLNHKWIDEKGNKKIADVMQDLDQWLLQF